MDDKKPREEKGEYWRRVGSVKKGSKDPGQEAGGLCGAERKGSGDFLPLEKAHARKASEAVASRSLYAYEPSPGRGALLAYASCRKSGDNKIHKP
jgi:hypothetical protein